MRRPTEQEIRAFLEAKTYRATEKPLEGAWGIGSGWVTDDRAMELAELALLTGQPLPTDVSVGLALNLARRLAVLEERLERLDPERTVPVTGIRFDSGNGAPTRDWRRLSPELPGSADAQTCAICGAGPFVPCSRDAHTEIAEETGGTDG